MSVDFENKLGQQIAVILATTDISDLQQWLQKMAETLKLQPYQLAAALLCLDAPTLALCQAWGRADNTLPEKEAQSSLQEAVLATTPKNLVSTPVEKQKMVRYRLEIGHNHQVSVEEIKSVLIDESGVDRSCIGYLDIRNTYTLIDLPPGMPPDIFQLLQTVEIKKQPLQIKRVNLSRKRPWQRRKSGVQNRSGLRESSQTEN